MSSSGIDPAGQFAKLVETMLARSEATYGADETRGARRSFGSTSLKARGKIFAMLVKGRLVVKLPASRVAELDGQGLGDQFDPGHGQVQKEWLSIGTDSMETWLALATESEAFLSRP